jgi:hypothetical protein
MSATRLGAHHRFHAPILGAPLPLGHCSHEEKCNNEARRKQQISSLQARWRNFRALDLQQWSIQSRERGGTPRGTVGTRFHRVELYGTILYLPLLSATFVDTFITKNSAERGNKNQRATETALGRWTRLPSRHLYCGPVLAQQVCPTSTAPGHLKSVGVSVRTQTIPASHRALQQCHQAPSSGRRSRSHAWADHNYS